MGRITLHDLLYGVYLCAVFFVGNNDIDRHLEQCHQIFFGQLRGGHCNVIFVLRIDLCIEEMIDGLYYFFTISQYNEEDQEPVLFLASG